MKIKLTKITMSIILLTLLTGCSNNTNSSNAEQTLCGVENCNNLVTKNDYGHGVACGSESLENKIISNAKEIINKDLSDNISINKCLYNQEENAVYLKFYSFDHGNDEAIIFLDNNSIFYSSVYSTIKEDDYDKIIEYGDYTLMMYQIANEDDSWIDVEISE